jgi:hypothetical protein
MGLDYDEPYNALQNIPREDPFLCTEMVICVKLIRDITVEFCKKMRNGGD